MLAVGILGASGRMGRLACTAVESADDLELAARVDRDDPLCLLEQCDVALDLTHPGVVMEHVTWCVEHAVPVVVGTSGITEERLGTIRELLEVQPATAVAVVPNFSVGAVLMMRFAAEAARFFESVEIVEMHHPDKRDAPSGTALRTASLVADARRHAERRDVPDATENDPLGARGGRADAVPVHSLRVRGAVAHQEVVLGNRGELLTLRHDMLDREATVAGMLACLRAAPTRQGLTVGLEAVLDLR